ncbi:hypothetical protein CPC08DRAFT_823181 [Agrocybe pediades]|nr:hypothetical protein CPC08DRAFT_823181 [Agrocybe pediades]
MSAAAPPSDEIAALLEGLHELQVIRYTRLVAVAAVIYDHIITFGVEVDLVWRGKWSLVKALFFMIRYYILAATIVTCYGIFTPVLTDRVSTRIFQWEIVTTSLSAILIQAVLQIRIYALYYKNKKILIFMLVAYGITTAFSAWVLSFDLSAGESLAMQIPGGATCTLPPLPSRAFAFWIPINVYDAILCALAVYRGFVTFRLERSSGTLGSTLLNVMLRDSVFVFGLLTLAYMAGLVEWIKAPIAYAQIPAAFTVAMCCVLGSRMILNIRETAMKRKSMGTSDKDFIELPVMSSARS